jgi:hypothetical protein
MLEILTDINKLNMFELESDNVLDSGYQGSWATYDANGRAALTTTSTSLAFPVWNESARAGTVGSFSPDTTATGKVTLLQGKMKAVTDQFSNYRGTLAIGSPLTVYSGGVLAKGTVGTDAIVGYVTGTNASYSYLGTTFSVIEFITL